MVFAVQKDGKKSFFTIVDMAGAEDPTLLRGIFYPERQDGVLNMVLTPFTIDEPSDPMVGIDQPFSRNMVLQRTNEARISQEVNARGFLH